MPFLILFLVLALPVLEYASIVEMSGWIGPVWTALLLAADFAFGLYLIRSQSMAMGRRAVEAMRSGSPPEQAILQSGAIMLAGVLFMIPGFFSDILALLLLLPEARRLIWRAVAPRLGAQARRTQPRPESWPGKPGRADDVIDAEFTEVPPEERKTGSPAHRDSPWSKG
jgi:UPF0716 protein FxsA